MDKNCIKKTKIFYVTLYTLFYYSQETKKYKKKSLYFLLLCNTYKSLCVVRCGNVKNLWSTINLVNGLNENILSSTVPNNDNAVHIYLYNKIRSTHLGIHYILWLVLSIYLLSSISFFGHWNDTLGWSQRKHMLSKRLRLIFKNIMGTMRWYLFSYIYEK